MIVIHLSMVKIVNIVKIVEIIKSCQISQSVSDKVTYWAVSWLKIIHIENIHLNHIKIFLT